MTQLFLPKYQLSHDVTNQGKHKKAYLKSAGNSGDDVDFTKVWQTVGGCVEALPESDIAQQMPDFSHMAEVAAGKAAKPNQKKADAYATAMLSAFELGAKGRALENGALKKSGYWTRVHDATVVANEPGFIMSRESAVSDGGGACATVDALRVAGGTHGQQPAVLMVETVADDMLTAMLSSGAKGSAACHAAAIEVDRVLRVSLAARIHHVESGVVVFTSRESVSNPGKKFVCVNIHTNKDIAAEALHYLHLGRACLKAWIDHKNDEESATADEKGYTTAMATAMTVEPAKRRRKTQFTTKMLQSEHCNPACHLHFNVASKTIMTVTR